MALVAVVDDDDDLRTLMTLRLTASGHEVISASDGQQGLDVIRRRRPDLVVLDWMMPRKTGIEVCRELRNAAEFATVPILVVTSRVSREDLSVAEAAGASGYLTKPFKLVDFLDAVGRLIGPAPAGAT